MLFRSPAQRSSYGDVERFGRVWSALAMALENSEDTHDFLEYRYCASLRHTLAKALTHLLSLSQSQDMPALGASLAGEEGKGIREHLIKYLRGEGEGSGGPGREGGKGGERDGEEGDSSNPQERVTALQKTRDRLRGACVEAEGGEGLGLDEARGAEMAVAFLEDVLRDRKSVV